MRSVLDRRGKPIAITTYSRQKRFQCGTCGFEIAGTRSRWLWRADEGDPRYELS